ncbi:SdpA family antimicrobial peptide system protein [Pyxidicoccus fallax]|uniref:SdpA family antimicrobial peptide system protein n=1 Tax=Pyxidicoccus fallax TaxID=394095 RepID=A0A848LB62_9BACT|nr:SdpA family antimicrobial peptide system protein [Pyxidicoccus fallax]NMO15877.1 SdpA family antimicrobial peptide system protein [Pyxidicoccus fallax]NPC81836.1 SdpA family antimicrobial peptide system protein [Pyxidicoccus fallax]
MSPSPTTPRRAAAPRSFVLAVITATALYGVLATYSIHSRLPFNTVRLPGERSHLSGPFSIQFVLPQGWKFFTKSPREPELALYRRLDSGTWEHVNPLPVSDSSGFFRLDRTARAQGVEMALLTHAIPAFDWKARCRRSDEDCLGDTVPVRTVRNLTPTPTLCGTIGFVAREPLPWAWASHRDTTRMPASSLVLRVQC